MASSYIELALESRKDPSSNAPAAATVTSAATPTTNTPAVTLTRLDFDDTTDESTMWTFRLPPNYLSGGTVTLLWGAAATTGNVVWKSGGSVSQASSTDIDTSGVFDSGGPDLSAATAVPGTSGQFKATSIALTLDTDVTPAAGDLVTVFVGRDANNGSDTAAGDAYLFGAEFSYTS